MDAVVDEKFSHDWDSTSIFSKVIGDKLSDGSIWDLYTHYGKNVSADTVQNQTPKFVDLGFSTIISLDEVSGISTTATRIQNPADGVYWRAPNHVFDENTAVRVSEAKSITIKLSFNFGKKIRNLSAKSFQ